MPILGLQLSLRVSLRAGGSPPPTPVFAALPVAWEDNSGIEDGYRVKYEPTAGGSQLTVDLAANSESYTIEGLLFNTQYAVEVVAFNGVGESLTLGPISLYTEPPAAPTLCTATQTGANTATIGWTLPGVEPVTGYRIYRSPAGAGTWAAVGTVAAGVATFGDTGLTAATAYDWRVVGYNSNAAASQPDSETAASNTATDTTAAGGCTVPRDTVTSSDNSSAAEVRYGELSWATRFQAAANATICRIDIDCYKSGTSSDLVYAEIFADSGGGTPVPTTLVGSSSTGRALSTFPDVVQSETFADVSAALTSGTFYWVVLRKANNDNANFLKLGTQNAGSVPLASNSGSWAQYANRVVNFALFSS